MQYPSNLFASSDNVAIASLINFILNDHSSKIPFLYVLHMGRDATKPVFGVQNLRFKPSRSATETS